MTKDGTIATTRPGRCRPRGARPPWAAELAEILAAEEAQRTAPVPERERTGLQHRKWRLLHKIVHGNPFQVSDRLPRHEQWMRVRDHVWRTIGEWEMIDWLNLQIEVARNIAAGIQDLRPRKDGSCHEVLLEYVANRKRKALAIHHWAIAAEADDASDHDDPPTDHR